MNNPRFQFLNWILLALVLVVVCGFQTTFWYQVVGSVPAPLLWLNVALYIILYRRGVEAILINYGLALFISPFTSMSLGMLWAVMLTLSVLINFSKKRIFWPGARYFMIASLGTTVAYQVISFALSQVVDANPVGWNFYSRVLEVIFTPLWAGPVYWLMSFVDRVSEKDPLPERGVHP